MYILHYIIRLSRVWMFDGNVWELIFQAVLARAGALTIPAELKLFRSYLLRQRLLILFVDYLF